MQSAYPDQDFPFTLYFNGEPMPRWGACWGLAHLPAFLKTESNDFHREVWALYCKIDHVGVIESAAPDFFVCAIQEIMLILLDQRDAALSNLKDQTYAPADEIYAGLIEAAFQMRAATTAQHFALWTSGYETDRQNLVEAIRCCCLPPDSPDFILFPHLAQRKSEMNSRSANQIRRLHEIAQSGTLDKSFRKNLHDLH